MLVNDTKEIRNVGMPSQFLPLWLQIKQSREVEIVFVTLNLLISGRGKDEFYDFLQNRRYALLCLQSEVCFILAYVKNCIIFPLC